MEHDAERDNLNGHRFVAPAMTRLALALDRHDLARAATEQAERAAGPAARAPAPRAAGRA